MSLFTIKIEVSPIDVRLHLPPTQTSGGDLEKTLVQIAASILNFKEAIMSALQDLQDKVDGLTAAAETANGKSDQLITLLADVRAQLAALQTAGGATPAELAAIGVQIDGVVESLAQQGRENDAAITPPTPTP